MKADLTFKGSNKKIKVLEFDYEFHQEVSGTVGAPTGFVNIAEINLLVESPASDTQLLDWMNSPLGLKSGKIEVSYTDNNKKTMEFKDAYCIYYQESFHYQGGDGAMTVRITIMPKEITITGVKFTRMQKFDQE